LTRTSLFPYTTLFRSLAQRDEWGTTHQTPQVNATDFAPRYSWRWIYYFKGRDRLVLDPAYVGSMQTALRRLGYYCGPVDGVFSPDRKSTRLNSSHVSI